MMYIDEKREIIAAGPTHEGDAMTLPHRIVIRTQSGSVCPYVVHMQIFNRDMSHGSFHKGDYVWDIERAMHFFVERIHKQLGIKEECTA